MQVSTLGVHNPTHSIYHVGVTRGGAGEPPAILTAASLARKGPGKRLHASRSSGGGNAAGAALCATVAIVCEKGLQLPGCRGQALCGLDCGVL